MTRFERARILGARALQISMGAPPIMANADGSAFDISVRELEDDLLPMTTVRLVYARN